MTPEGALRIVHEFMFIRLAEQTIKALRAAGHIYFPEKAMSVLCTVSVLKLSLSPETPTWHRHLPHLTVFIGGDGEVLLQNTSPVVGGLGLPIECQTNSGAQSSTFERKNGVQRP